MNVLHYFLLAALVLEVSLILQTTAKEDTKAASKSVSLGKKPKIERTVRVRESAPEAPPTDSNPSSIHNEGSSNSVDLNPNISIQVPPPQQPEPKQPEVESTGQIEPRAQAQMKSAEILEAGDMGNVKITKIGNVGNRELNEINDVDNTRLTPKALQQQTGPGGKIDPSFGTPLFQININGQESGLAATGPPASHFRPPISPAETLLEASLARLLLPGGPLERPPMMSGAQQPAFPAGQFFQQPYPMGVFSAPVVLAPMWSPFGPPFPWWAAEEPPAGWRRHKRRSIKEKRKERKEKKPKKEKKERKEDEVEKEPEVTPAPTIQLQAVEVPPATLVQKVVPEVPKLAPIQEIEWETVRVPRMKRKD